MEKDRAADGLRGIAALAVFFEHFLLIFYPGGFQHFFPWVAAPGAHSGWAEKVLQWPFVSALISGGLAVCIFFVLSGYVLTKQYTKSANIDALRSLAGRRYLRLGIPVFASVMLSYGLFCLLPYQVNAVAEITKSAWLTSQSIQGQPGLLDALKDGVYGAIFLGRVGLNSPLWTIRIEFIGSMLIFAYSALAWTGRRGLISAATYLALIYFYAPQEWPYYLAFLLGSYLGNAKIRLNGWASAGSVLAALYLASLDGSPMFAWLHKLPFEPGILASLCYVLAGGLIVLVARYGTFGRIFTARPIQFLGRISYPLYLVHVPIIMTMGCGVFLSVQAGTMRSLAVAVTLVATLAMVILVAWIFERYVDQPAIRLSKLLVRHERRNPAMVTDAAR